MSLRLAEMASGSDGNDQNDVASSPPRTEETPADSKKQRLNPTTETPLSLPSSSNTPPSGNPVYAPPLPTLPFELIVEILSRLTVKILLQLRRVCKSWKTLISDPQFAKKHLHDSPTTMHLILCIRNSSRESLLWSCPLPSVFNAVTTTATQLRYPLNNPGHFNLIVNSCNGILCFQIDQNHSLLWNPCIGKFKKLPSLEYPKREGSYTMFGFGYDPFADSYKVIAVFCCQCRSSTSGYKTEVKIYTLGTDSWRRIEDFPSGVPFNQLGLFVNGTANWLTSDPSSSTWVIVSLDLGKESYQEILQPDYRGLDLHSLTLEVLRDCFCILSHHDTFSDVWLMKEFGNRESWTKLFRVPNMGNPNSVGYERALYMSEDDQVLLEYRSNVLVYESRNGNFMIPRFVNIIKGWVVPEVYCQSLISPCF